MNSVIFEDDYDSEFRDASEARPALASALAEDPNVVVLHAGTFSKLIFPAARVAWLVVPPSDIEKAHQLLRAIGGGHTAVAQATVTELLDNGTVAKHLQKARGIYAQRRDEIIRLLNRSPLFTEISQTGGSLSLVAPLIRPVPRKKLIKSLESLELGARCLDDLIPGSRALKTRALVIGLGNVSTMNIPKVFRRLEKAVSP